MPIANKSSYHEKNVLSKVRTSNFHKVKEETCQLLNVVNLNVKVCVTYCVRSIQTIITTSNATFDICMKCLMNKTCAELDEKSKQ